MSKITYTAISRTADEVGYENYTPQDLNLTDPFAINSQFNSNIHNIELHIYDLAAKRLRSIYNYTGARQQQDSAGAGKEGVDILYINPIEDALNQGYNRGGVRLLYNFLNPLSNQEFFIKEISPDRTEIRVLPVDTDFEGLNEFTQQIQDKLQSKAYFDEFRLNFLNNDLLIGVNISEYDGVIIKLYQPLPEEYTEKDVFTFVETVADSVSFEIQAEEEITPIEPPKLRGPNFNLEVEQESAPPTEYLSYDNLYNYPVNSTYYQAATILSGSSVEVSIDYSDFSNFIHFSSAKERLANFKYKLDLIHAYEEQVTSITSISGSSSIVTASNQEYERLIANVISKFDGYEKYMYFESSSVAWPKSNSIQPYINYKSTETPAVNFYVSQSDIAEDYDNLNESRLTYTTPEFIRDDSSNAPYSIFLDMIGQHFDNLWIYAKGVTDKYEADNRLNYGVSKDLISEVLKSFGVKLYSSNFSISNLAASFLGEFYQSGSEQITTFVTASNNPTPDKDILSETYKRIYHNLPYLTKTKGTERGLRALINCFGIPSGSLQIREYGGHIQSGSQYYGYGDSPESKIRINNTGSLVSGSTLSRYTSIQTPDNSYTQDLHSIEVAFSPTYYVNDAISGSLSNFYLDQYIGDPRHATSTSYPDLDTLKATVFSSIEKYNVFDFIRLIKFFDNQLFKMIKDYVPARANVSTGVVVKPHYLERSKYPKPQASFNQPEYSGSIDTAFITGSSGDTFLTNTSTQHTLTISTLSGSVELDINNERPKLDGELGGSTIVGATQNLNLANTFKKNSVLLANYDTVKYIKGTTTEVPAIPSNIFVEHPDPASGEITILVYENDDPGLPVPGPAV